MFIVFERINHDQCVTLQMQYLLDLYIMQVFKNTFQAIPYLAQKTLTILNIINPILAKLTLEWQFSRL